MIKRKDYQNALIKGNLLSKSQQQNILLSVFELIARAEPIFFKDGKWQPLKWRSFGRWVKLANLAYDFIKLVVSIINKK